MTTKLLIVACLAAVLSFSSLTSSGQDRKGLVKEKPAEGPFVETDQGFMVPYKETIPGTDVTFTMIPVPGGTFMLGSPDDEEGRMDVEGPQVKVNVAPFWIGKHEVTWAEYKSFTDLHDALLKLSQGPRKVTEDNKIDVVTIPSKLYDPTFTFSAGDGPQEPAATMTQYAAKQYTKWLSLLADDFYRLPTEAEWEYACRAGTTTAYSFGDDPAELGDYAWFADNSDDRRHEVGQKKPNPWGLYDMHGNVSEWVLDAYTEDGYEQIASEMVVDAMDVIQWPEEVYPLTTRGGSWELAAEELRSAARLGSDDESWKDEDPNVPLSPWWFTTSPATGVGMRLVRPLHVPKDREAKEVFWRTRNEVLELDVEYRIDSEGRGSRGVIDENLPSALEKNKDR